MRLVFQLGIVAVFGVGLGFGQAVTTQAVGALTASTSKAILQPAVMALMQAMDLVRVEKWKASKEVKAATSGNVASIQRDLDATLPGLVTAADTAPGSVTAMLPLTRNVDALYDVALRVTVIAESAAPGEQADALQKALQGMEAARRSLADRTQQLAAGAEGTIVELQKASNARVAAAPVCAPIAAAPLGARKTAPRHAKPVRKAPAQTTPQGAAK